MFHKTALSMLIAALILGGTLTSSQAETLEDNEAVPLLVACVPLKATLSLNPSETGFRICYVSDPDWAVPYRQVKDAVVSVDIEYRSADGQVKCKGSHGTGTLITADGLIVTDTHVIADPSQLPTELGKSPQKTITITDSKQNTYEVEEIGGEHTSDLSFVHVVRKPKSVKFSFIKLAESSELAARKNGFVVGYPLSYNRPLISGGAYNGMVKLSAVPSKLLPDENPERNLQIWSSKGLAGQSGGPHFVQTQEGPRLVGVQSRSNADKNLSTPVEDVRRGLGNVVGIRENTDGTFAFDENQYRRGQKKAS